MSNGKRFWLPTQKGTELFPKITQAPARLIIRGVPPGSPLYHAVANVYAGRLKSFHAKSQQSYSLSNNQIAKQRFDWGDGARATYTNVQGQEILELEVDVPVLERLEQPKPEQPEIKIKPNWAVIEIRVPSIAGSQGLWLAKLGVSKPPGSIGLVELPQLNMTGIRDAAHVFSLNNAWFDFALASPDSIEMPRPSEVVASLLVDLRPYHYLPSIAIELYGYMESYVVDDLIPVGTIRAAIKWVITEGPDAGTVVVNFYAGFSGITIGGLVDLYPELASATFIEDIEVHDYTTPTFTYDGGARTLVATGNFVTELNNTDGSLALVEYDVTSYDEDGVYETGLRVSSVMVCLLDLNEPDWNWQTYHMAIPLPALSTLSTSWNRWYIDDGTPLDYARIGEVTVQIKRDLDVDSDGTPLRMPPMPFLGVLTIDMEHRVGGLAVPA